MEETTFLNEKIKILKQTAKEYFQSADEELKKKDIIPPLSYISNH